MATITVSIRKDQPDKKGLCRLVILYRHGNEAAYKHSINEKVLPSQFDEDKQRVIKHDRVDEINFIINKNKMLLQDIIFDLKRKDIEPTTERVKRIAKRKKDTVQIESLHKKNTSNPKIKTWDEICEERDSPKTIPAPYLAWKEFVSLKKNLVAKSTLSVYNTTLDHLKDYCVNHGRLLNWQLFDTDFYNLWNNYFIEECENQYGDIGLSNNTIGKYFKTLKTFLYWAIEKEYHTNLKFTKYKVIQEESDIHPLSEGHIAKIVEFADDTSNNERLRKVASLFVFLTATGLRYSDGQNLTWSDLYYSSYGDIEQQVIKVTTKKTNQRIIIPLSVYSISELTRNAFDFDKGKLLIADILKPDNSLFDHSNLLKYFNNETELDEPMLPKIHSVKFNEDIKKVGEKCGFFEPITVVRKSGANTTKTIYKRWEKLTAHDCRRTFITLSLSKGMRPETVMSITGHKSYKTMLRYNKISEEMKVEEFQSVWGKSKMTYNDILGMMKVGVLSKDSKDNKNSQLNFE